MGFFLIVISTSFFLSVIVCFCTHDNIECCAAKSVLTKGARECVLINEAATRCVHDESGRFHSLQAGLVQHVVVSLGGATV